MKTYRKLHNKLLACMIPYAWAAEHYREETSNSSISHTFILSTSSIAATYLLTLDINGRSIGLKITFHNSNIMHSFSMIVCITTDFRLKSVVSRAATESGRFRKKSNCARFYGLTLAIFRLNEIIHALS